MRPVRKLLGETRRVFLSPDSALNLIPFGALVDEQNRYLVENYSLTYLTSGRDLLRLQVKTDSKQGPVVNRESSV
jgi:CHAT domain-containing protein